MPKRAWCSSCNTYVMLTAEELCPNGHPRPALRGVEEVGAGTAMPSAPAHRPAPAPAAVPAATHPQAIPSELGVGAPTGYGPPPGSSFASEGFSADTGFEALPRTSTGIPLWMPVAGVLVALALGFGGYKLVFGPKHGVVHTANGMTVTVPSGWGVVQDKPAAFLVTPDGNDKIAVEVDRMTGSKEVGGDLVTAERGGAEREGLHVDDVTWLGHSGISYRSQNGAIGQLRTEVWDGNATTYIADYNAAGSDFDAHLAEAKAIVASVQSATQ